MATSESTCIRAIAELWATDAAKLPHLCAGAAGVQGRSIGGRGVPSAWHTGRTGSGSGEPLEGAFRDFFCFSIFFRVKIVAALILGKQTNADTELQAMNEPHDSNETVDERSAPADSLDAGLAVGFGRPVDGPASVLSRLDPR